MSRNEIKQNLIKHHTFLSRLDWLPTLLGRVTLGWVFFTAGAVRFYD